MDKDTLIGIDYAMCDLMALQSHPDFDDKVWAFVDRICTMPTKELKNQTLTLKEKNNG